MKKGYATIIGYLLFLMGILSIILSMVGLQLTFLSWIQSFGTGVSIIIKIVMLFSGLIIMYISKMPTEDDNLETSL
ncbi:MAG: hypothetical protein ACI86M_000331 [Saprospiraceae bacterium]|jgi:hypothetical protein